MKITLTLAWPGLATVLALILAAEWLLPGPGDLRQLRPVVLPRAGAGGMEVRAVRQWADICLARPLFEPDRRPPAQPGSSTSTSLPRLSAIMIIGGQRLAIFTPDGQKPQIVAANGIISGYRVLQISPGSVVVLGPEGKLTLRPQFKSASGADAAGDDPPGIMPANNGSSFDDEVPMNAP